MHSSFGVARSLSITFYLSADSVRRRRRSDPEEVEGRYQLISGTVTTRPAALRAVQSVSDITCMCEWVSCDSRKEWNEKEESEAS